MLCNDKGRIRWHDYILDQFSFMRMEYQGLYKHFWTTNDISILRLQNVCPTKCIAAKLFKLFLPYLIICIMKLLSFDTYTILKDRYTIYIYYKAYILSGRYFARLLSDEQTTACHLSFLFLATFTTPLFFEWFTGNYDLKQISPNKT